VPTPPRELPAPLRVLDRTWVVAGGQKLSYFCGCDYLGLSGHPEVLRALSTATMEYGASIGASRITTGNHPLHLELEAALAQFFAVPAATLLPNGYTAVLAAAQALAGQFNVVFIDEKIHPAGRDGAACAGARVQMFRHRDPADLARHLRRAGKRARPLVMADGMFAFDGSLAPLAQYLAILPAHGRLLVDDAQAAGVLGAQGRGTPEHAGISPRQQARLIHVISLSKGFGTTGGAVLGSKALRQAVISRSRIFSGSTPLSAPLAAAALTAVRLAGDGSLRQRLWANVARVRAALANSRQAAAAPSPSPVVALLPRNATDAAALRDLLQMTGIYPGFIHYPGGPRSGYFRLALSSEHSAQQISALAAVLGAYYQA